MGIISITRDVGLDRQVKKDIHIPVLHEPTPGNATIFRQKHLLSNGLKLAHKKTYLTYDAAAERLFGVIDTYSVDDHNVYSGGSRGHSSEKLIGKKKYEERAKQFLYSDADTLKSKLATTQLKEQMVNGKKQMTQRGGTLPPGEYRCVFAIKPHLGGECIQLLFTPSSALIHTPFAIGNAFPHGRSVFFIHKYGAMGSDGCLVYSESEEKQRLRLNKEVKKFDGEVILRVINVGYTLPAEIGGVFV